MRVVTCLLLHELEFCCAMGSGGERDFSGIISKNGTCQEFIYFCQIQMVKTIFFSSFFDE